MLSKSHENTRKLTDLLAGTLAVPLLKRLSMTATCNMPQELKRRVSTQAAPMVRRLLHQDLHVYTHFGPDADLDPFCTEYTATVPMMTEACFMCSVASASTTGSCKHPEDMEWLQEHVES